jgi:hypothetical protein
MLRSLLIAFSLMVCQFTMAAEPDQKAILQLIGKVTQVQSLSLAELEKLPQKKMTVVTPWYPDAQTFEGPLLRDVLKQSGVKTGLLKMQALNDYIIEIPVADAYQYDVIIATRLNGKAMSVREKGPLFVMYPFDKHEELRKTDYFRRCIWQLKQIAVE